MANIKQVKINNITYDIYDASAIHNVEDLGLGQALIFKGTKETEA